MLTIIVNPRSRLIMAGVPMRALLNLLMSKLARLLPALRSRRLWLVMEMLPQ
jgi:hypothetical protein